MIYDRNQAMAVLDIVNKSEVRQIYDHKLDTGKNFVAGEWAFVKQNLAADGETLTAYKMTGGSAPAVGDLGKMYLPCFEDTEENSSAIILGHGAFVHDPHMAWTDYFNGTIAVTDELTIVDGKMEAATTGDLVVAIALSSITAKNFWSQGSPTQPAIKYKTVTPYIAA